MGSPAPLTCLTLEYPALMCFLLTVYGSSKCWWPAHRRGESSMRLASTDPEDPRATRPQTQTRSRCPRLLPGSETRAHHETIACTRP